MFGYKISSFFLILVLLLSVTNLQAFSTTQLNSNSNYLNGLSTGLIGVAFADDDEDEDDEDDNGKDKKEKKEKKDKKDGKHEIKVEIEDGEAEVEIKINGIESELELDTNDLDEILTLIQTITGLSESEIKDIWEIEIEENGDDEDHGKKDKKDGKHEIKVEIEDGEAEVEIKINGIESELELKNTELDDILNIIQLITGLSESEIKDIWEVKIEEDDEDDDEDDHGKKDKVTICHIPPGNPGNAHTINVSGNAEYAHLAHGDTLGECPDSDDVSQDNTTTITLTKQVTNDNQGTSGSDDFMISVNGTIVLSGSITEVAPNVLFAINETVADGYEFVEITGDPECPTNLDEETISLAPGQDINCIIHNNDVDQALASSFQTSESTSEVTTSDNEELSQLIDENKKLKEDIERQGTQIDDLNEQIDFLSELIASIQSFFGNIFG